MKIYDIINAYTQKGYYIYTYVIDNQVVKVEVKIKDGKQ